MTNLQVLALLTVILFFLGFWVGIHRERVASLGALIIYLILGLPVFIYAAVVLFQSFSE